VRLIKTFSLDINVILLLGHSVCSLLPVGFVGFLFCHVVLVLIDMFEGERLFDFSVTHTNIYTCTHVH